MNKTIKKLISVVIYPFIVIGVILTIWAIAAAVIDKPLVLPKINAVFGQFFMLLKKPYFYSAVFGTLLRCLAGFLMAFALALVLAVISALSLRVKKVIIPLMSIMRSLPTLAVVLIFLIWTNGFIAPVIIALIIVMPVLYSSFISAAASCPLELLETAKIFGRTNLSAINKCYLPYIFFVMPESAASAFSMNIKLVIAAEIICQSVKSLGALMQLSQIYLETAQLLAMTLFAVLMSVILEFVIKKVLKIILKNYADLY